MIHQSQSLFQQMVFCNIIRQIFLALRMVSQSLFQQMVFCNISRANSKTIKNAVTILILVDGFLQYKTIIKELQQDESQSLFQQMVFCNIKKNGKKAKEACHNPYFSRWFSAIEFLSQMGDGFYCHNPYFSRWFSAIACQSTSM